VILVDREEIPGRTRNLVEVADARARWRALRPTVDAAGDPVHPGEVAPARDVLDELDHGLLALADRAGRHGRTVVEHELPGAGHVLTADEDRQIGKSSMNGANDVLDVRPLLREHHRDAERVGRGVDAFDDLRNREAVVDQIRLGGRAPLQRSFPEGIDHGDPVTGLEEGGRDVRGPERQHDPDRVREARRDRRRPEQRDVAAG
jgi:hypothetical protein